MKRKAVRMPLWLLALLPLVLVALCYDRLPSQVPLPWSGEATGSKTQLWLLALLGPVLALLPRLGRGKLRRYLEIAALILLLILNVVTAALTANLLLYDDLSWARMFLSLLGLLYLFLGSEEGKVKPNTDTGIRNRWTLTDPDVWNRTHRLSGKLLFASGLLVLLSSFLLAELATFFLLAACSAVCLAVPAVMSRVWYKRLHPPGDSPPDT